MSNTPAFRYRYGLSFPGQITDEALAPVDFRAVVQQVAERMCASCENKPERILYDRFHQGVLAETALRRLAVPPWRRRRLAFAFVHKAPCWLPGQRQRLRDAIAPGHPSTAPPLHRPPHPTAAAAPCGKPTGAPKNKPTHKPTDKTTDRPTDKQTERPTDEPIRGQGTSKVGRPVISQSRP
jgi:hypothetical protein